MLELGLSFSYFGPERGFPGSFGTGEPKGEVRGKRPGGGRVARRRGLSGKMGSPGLGPRDWISSRRKHCHFSMLKMQEAAKLNFLRQNRKKETTEVNLKSRKSAFFR